MQNKLNIVVDGLIYQLQARGGISRILNEILPRICTLEPSAEIMLVTQGRSRQTLPLHSQITHRSLVPIDRYLNSQRMWKPLVPTAKWISGLMARQLISEDGAEAIWHSTYYTVPEKWDGPTIITVADTIHESFPDLFTGENNDLFRERKRRCIEAADAVICISETTREDVQKFYNVTPKLLHVAHLACSDVFVRLDENDVQIPTERPFFFYIGSRIHYKNFGTFIKGYQKWSRNKDIDLVLVGEGLSQEEDSKLRQMGISDQIHVMTNVNDTILCGLYNTAAGFVYPSLYEGFGIPLLEAMSCGCPVIASRIPSTVEIAGDCPIYFDPHNIDDLISAFELVLSEGKTSGRIKEGFLKAESYSWNKTAEQTLNVYRKVLGRKKVLAATRRSGS